MLNKQDLVRTKLNNFIKSRGIKANFICGQCNIDTSLLSKFRNNKRDLWDSTLEQLEKFIDEQ